MDISLNETTIAAPPTVVCGNSLQPRVSAGPSQVLKSDRAHASDDLKNIRKI